jgi:uncharacterized protein (DUF1330 family)
VAVDPRGADLKRYLAEDPSGPVVMLNLLRFKPDGGRERYLQYVEHFNRTAKPYGARTVYVGDGLTPVVAEEGQAWDAVLLVEYPSRQAFTDMIRDPEYQKGTHLRTEALEEAVLQATKRWEL